MQYCWEHTFVQNYWHFNIRKGKAKYKLLLDTLEVDWTEVNVTFNGNTVNLPRIVTLKLKDELKLDEC